MEIVLWGAVFCFSLFVLIKAADLFIECTEQISLSFNIPSFIVGATLVSVGTSLPELISSGISVVTGESEIVVGNVVGSNVANIFLIIGATILISGRILINFSNLKYDFLLLLASALLLTYFLYDMKFSAVERFISISCVFVYLVYIIKFHKLAGSKHIETEETEKIGPVTYLKLLASAGLIFAGAYFTVESIEKMSSILGLGSGIIALSALSIGTSLPELVVSINAARKGLTDIVIGNILGSNVFNTFAVMGFPALLGPVAIPEVISQFSLPLMVLATILFFVSAVRKSAGWITGLIFVLLYAFFLYGIFGKIELVRSIMELI